MKTKKQLRAEAVERLKLLQANYGIECNNFAHEIVKAATCAHYSYDNAIDVLIDLLTDDDSNDTLEPNKVVSCDADTSNDNDLDLDSREKLEVEIDKFVPSHGDVPKFARPVTVTRDTIIEWLDRQAALTERKWIEYLADATRQIDRLEKERDEYIALWEEREAICEECENDHDKQLFAMLEQRNEARRERDKLLSCLENDYGIKATWDGLRNVWITEKVYSDPKDETDTRAKIENDMMKERDSFFHTPYGLRKIRKYLDRQAAITAREWSNNVALIESHIPNAAKEMTVFGMSLEEVRDLKYKCHELQHRVDQLLANESKVQERCGQCADFTCERDKLLSQNKELRMQLKHMTYSRDLWKSRYTEVKPILDRNGMPIKVGDVLYGQDNIAWKVYGLKKDMKHSVLAEHIRADGTIILRNLKPEWLSRPQISGFYCDSNGTQILY